MEVVRREAAGPGEEGGPGVVRMKCIVEWVARGGSLAGRVKPGNSDNNAVYTEVVASTEGVCSERMPVFTGAPEAVSEVTSVRR